jgi:hypothetical protein
MPNLDAKDPTHGALTGACAAFAALSNRAHAHALPPSRILHTCSFIL